MKILFVGGGTMGSVSPLLAISQKIKAELGQRNESVGFLWLGTKSGPEREVVEKNNIRFQVVAAGKLRRYFDWHNVADVFNILVAMWQSFFILIKFRPQVILTAGSFVAVPVAVVGWILGVPIFVHQQDVEVGLANKIMSLLAKKITVALEESVRDFPARKTVLVGNPVRKFPISNFQFPNRSQILNLKFQNTLPTILILGGGTGAVAINELVWQALPELIKFCNLVHITGKNKGNIDENENYKQFEFLGDEIFEAIKMSTLVVSRAGMSALTELAYFSKPTIIIPIPNSHQEKNAKYFQEKNAGVYLRQNELTVEIFVAEIQNLLNDEAKKKDLGKNMHNIFIDYSGEKMVEEILKFK
ncbi:MAG TPA: UDP-N-acetylglucosamine--N-acetylmuramyl-(pentapeptide) pyrophosphoryl-undecaprenol N-acetylglucosamine transferase [bacterium]|nr:UDP-N-acetylglucosamine--N-acetylmuramyl-(pentapeptide) pyrophosphoryl-undecaprenol N-acetylglucosamine transferase [bacterium]